jgi:endoglucanase
MLLAYELFPDRFSNDDLNIPESGNSIPDLLDENKYEIDWFFKMQNTDGGVFFKVTKNNFESFIMPNYDSGMRNIYTVSSTATGDFASVLAKASRIYSAFDTSFSNKCLTAAELAWSYLEAHSSIVPAGGFINPSDTFTGGYGDSDDRDERLWAACELFLATGKEKYHNYFKAHYNEAGIFTGVMGWGNVRSLVLLTYLLSDNPSTDLSIKNTLKAALKTYCDKLVTRRNSSGFHLTLSSSEFNWGCNSDVLNKAILLIAEYQLTNDMNYYNTALDQLNYILGCNAHNLSFVTGTGTSSVMHPHHRPSEADKITAPVPGLLAGGPNKYLGDDVLKAHFNSSTPPALCYVDVMESYASNEVAINWNSPLVFVTGFFKGAGKPSGIGSLEQIIPSRIKLEQNFPNPFNGSTVIRFHLPADENVTINIFDSLGNLVHTKDLDFCRSGENYYVWNSNDGTVNQPATGIYFYQVIGRTYAASKKMILLK